MTETNDVAEAEHLLRGLTHGDRPLHAALRTLLAEYVRRGGRIVDLEAGREVEQHMVRYAAVQLEEAERQRDVALSLLDRKTADTFALSRLLRGMARRTAVLRGKLLDEYLPDRGASRAPREPCERQDYDVDGLRQQLAAVKALAERWDFSAPVGASQLRCALDGRSGDGGYSGGSPGDLNRVAADLMERHGHLPLSMRYAMASAILGQQARNARVSTAAGPPGEPGPAADTRPRAEHPCPDCGDEVLRVDHAMDPSDYQCRDQFDCCWTGEAHEATVRHPRWAVKRLAPSPASPSDPAPKPETS